jgi:membrane fusion protein (multidrug efflux system)
MTTMIEPEPAEPHVKEPRTSRAAGAAAEPPRLRGPEPASRRRPIAFIILGVALIALGVGGVRRWMWGRTHVSSDNAQVDGHIVPILPKVGGFVAEVRVEENEPVKAGDLLVVLDDRDFRSRLAQTQADYAAALAAVSSNTRVGQAEAAIRQAEANARKAHADLDRILPLANQQIVSQQQLDAAQAAAAAADAQLVASQAALAAADARVASARAAMDQAALQLSYARLTAPVSGVVSKKTVEVGQLVQSGQPLMSVVPLNDVWVVANLKETEVQNVSPGDAVDITVDAYPGLHVAGQVESLSPATGAKFSLLPPDNATGNFTKVVQRIPVRIRLDRPNDPEHPLRPGMSVVVTVTTQ